MTSKVPPPIWSPKPQIPPELPSEPTTGVNELPVSQNTLPTKGRRWFPNAPQIVALSVLVGGLVALVDVLSADAVTTRLAILAFFKGALAQLMLYMGMRSAGPKQS